MISIRPLVHACRKIVKRMMDSDRHCTGKQQASDSQTIGDGRVLEGGMNGPITAFAHLCASIMGRLRAAKRLVWWFLPLLASTCRWICDRPWGRIVRLAVCVRVAATAVC